MSLFVALVDHGLEAALFAEVVFKIALLLLQEVRVDQLNTLYA